jgi:tRNA A37 threonylcarbamoyladenosine biosynthesis protein TsaE
MNKEQKEGIEKMTRFLLSNKNEFCLKGAAGTGKTTIVKEVLKNFPNSD